MRQTKLRRPAPGTVLGLLALIVAVAGNASAFSSPRVVVRRGDIAPGAVTARALAKGAVHPKALAKGAVTAGKLKPGSVTASKLASGAVGAGTIRPGAVGSAALAPDSVTSAALAPGSVYGGALGPVDVHGAAVHDVDAVPSNPEWTASTTANAACAPGEHLLTGGFVFTNPGNREVAPLAAIPYLNSGGQGVIGQITSNSGGSAEAEVEAVCLK